MDRKVIVRLDKTLIKYQELSATLLDPNTLKDVNKFKLVAKQKASMEDIAEAYLEHQALEHEIQELEEMAKLDSELQELAEEELKVLAIKKNKLVDKLKLLLIPKDGNDSKNIICEIKGAAGGDEANIFAGDLFRMYTKYVEIKGWKITVLEVKNSESGGFSHIAFKITGKNVYSKLKFEAGTHRVQRVPKTESKGRVHTSTATVAILPEVNDVVVSIQPKELRVDTYRSSGAGGQHVNTTDSAIRITHIPTGIVVTSQDGRSQHDNKALAMEHLRSRLYQHAKAEQDAGINSLREEAVGTGDRSEKIRTYNYPQNRVTDHRIKQSWNKLNLIMEGQLIEIITALIIDERQTKMETFSSEY